MYLLPVSCTSNTRQKKLAPQGSAPRCTCDTQIGHVRSGNFPHHTASTPSIKALLSTTGTPTPVAIKDRTFMADGLSHAVTKETRVARGTLKDLGRWSSSLGNQRNTYTSSPPHGAQVTNPTRTI